MVRSDGSRDYADGNKDVGWNPLGIGRTALTNALSLITLPFLSCQELRGDARRKTEKDAKSASLKSKRASFDTTDLCTGTSFTSKKYLWLVCGSTLWPEASMKTRWQASEPLAHTQSA